MSTDFRTYSPKEYFSVFVDRSFKEYLEAPLDHYRVKMAVTNADVMAERMWQWWHQKDPTRIENAKSAREYRQLLVKREPNFQLVWDIHDGQKHVELKRKGRKVTSTAQTGVGMRGGAYQQNAFQNDAFQGGKPTF